MSLTGKVEKVPGTRYLRETGPLSPGPASFNMTGALSLFSGSASMDLGREIADYMNVHQGEYTRTVFSNENILIQLNESVRGRDVYLVQTMASPVHDNLMELLLMVDTLKRDSAGRINVVVPYLSYSRSDKKDQPRVGIAARLVANLIEAAGANRYMTIDLHAGQLQGFFDIPGDALTAFYLLSDHVDDMAIPNLVVVSADLGFSKKGRNWAERLGTPHAIVEKRRVDNEESPDVLSIIGDVRDRNVLLVDDEVLTAGSACQAVQAIREHGARDVYFAFTHALMPAEGYERLAQLGLKHIICTNTLPVPLECRLPNMTVLSVAPLLGEVILRAHAGRSVGELFDE
ncbi:MAG: ribose-phosphate diphosphokinase [Anaerolineaceae bacterium]|nr:ribose-phosphate diphosphokinase [Anaerolineaceae bacterium]